MHSNRMRLEPRRPNHHSTHSDGTPRSHRRARPTRTRSRTAGGRNRAATSSVFVDTGTVLATPNPTTQTDVSARTALRVLSSTAAVPPTISAAPSLPIIMSSARSSSALSPSRSSSSNSIASAEASTSAKPVSATPNNANKYVPAILASLFVVLAAALLIFGLHRRRKLARKRDALTSLAPSPYKVDDLDEKGGYIDYHNGEAGHDAMREKYEPDQTPQPNYAGRPKSFLVALRHTFSFGRKSKSTPRPDDHSHPWDWQPSSETPPIPKVPAVTQIPIANHDPFRDGFGPGANQLATGLATTTMSSQSSTHSDDPYAQGLSHKQSLSSNASTSLARRWPQGTGNGHESLSQGPAVRTLYNGVQVESVDEEDEQVYEDAYAYGGEAYLEQEEELANSQRASVASGVIQHASIRSVRASGAVDEQGRHLSQSTDQGRSIRFGTLRSQSDNGEMIEEPAWQRT